MNTYFNSKHLENVQYRDQHMNLQIIEKNKTRRLVNDRKNKTYVTMYFLWGNGEKSKPWLPMGLLRDIQNCRLRMRRECRERFLRYRGLAIPTCITARAWSTCRDACRDRLPAVSFEVGGGENVPGITGSCATRNFTYLIVSPRHQTPRYYLCVVNCSTSSTKLV